MILLIINVIDSQYNTNQLPTSLGTFIFVNYGYTETTVNQGKGYGLGVRIPTIHKNKGLGSTGTTKPLIFDWL